MTPPFARAAESWEQLLTVVPVPVPPPVVPAPYPTSWSTGACAVARATKARACTKRVWKVIFEYGPKIGIVVEDMILELKSPAVEFVSSK
jgi:hypothetical protein